MARARNPQREDALRIYLDSGGAITPTEIAERLGLPASRIRKWKSEDKWERHKKERSDSGKRNAPKSERRRGGQPGNKNAVGHGAPLGNQNAVTTGEYSAIWMYALSDDERCLCDRVDTDPLALIDETIQLLSIRELRMLKRLEELRNQKELAENEDAIVFTKKAPRGALVARKRYTKLLIDKIILVEEALTRVQEKKLRAIETKQKLLNARGSSEDTALSITIQTKKERD